MELNKIYNMDCVNGIKLLDDNSIDLVVTSPPYNVDLGNNKFNKNAYDIHNDNMKHENYIKWLSNIFGLLYSKIKPGGRICINIGDGKNGQVITSSDIKQFMIKEHGYLMLTNIIWNKNQVGSRTAWGSFNSPSCPSFPTPFEYIMVFAKDTLKLQTNGETDLTKKEFIEWSLSMWSFKPETNDFYNHPAPFPEELPLRLIKMLSWKNATVMDIFSGSGTTCKVAHEIGRKYIGFELSREYYETSIKRIKEFDNKISIFDFMEE